MMFSNCFISDSCASVRGKIFNSMLLFRYAKKRNERLSRVVGYRATCLESLEKVEKFKLNAFIN